MSGPRRSMSKGLLAVLVVASLALTCVGSGVALRLALDGSQTPFASTCLTTPVGAAIADADAAFARIGVTSSGHGWRGRGPGGPPDSYSFFRRTGLTRWQQCTIDVDPSTQRIAATALTARTDFTSCTDRRSYPRRFWLCAIGDALAL